MRDPSGVEAALLEIRRQFADVSLLIDLRIETRVRRKRTEALLLKELRKLHAQVGEAIAALSGQEGGEA